MAQPLHILIIEDNEDDALLVLRAIRRGGYDPISQRVDSPDALHEVLFSQPWEIIITDYRMPQFTAVDALNILQESGLDLPFIVLSGEISEQQAIDLMRAGADDYLMKGQLARLLPVIERELRENQVRHDRRAAEEELRRRNRELTVLNRVIAASVEGGAPDTILQVACTELARAFEMPLVLAILVRPLAHDVEIVAEHNAGQFPPSLNMRFPATDGPVWEALTHDGGPIIIENAQTDPRLHFARERITQYGVVSMLLLPLTIDDELAGLLVLGSEHQRDFSFEDLSIGWRVAVQMASVLAQSRLNQEYHLLSTAMAQMVEGVMILDHNYKIRYVNPAFEAITGYSDEEAIGQGPLILRSEYHNPIQYKELDKARREGEVWQGHIVNRRKDDSTYIAEVILGPVRDKQGNITHYIDVHRDITQVVELEEKYRQSQKMEAVGQLTAGIAHDFNNLLTSINGFSELLQMSMAPSDPRQRDIEKIMHCGDRATDLIRQLMAFSRKAIIKPEILDLNNVVSRMDQLLYRTLGEHILLQVQICPVSCLVRMDPTQLEQIILNLAVNARDAMPTGGTLTISTDIFTLDAVEAGALELNTGRHVLLTLEDTGQGMSRQTKARIFEPFFTTKQPGNGTGLGLATVFGIIKQSNGAITVASEVDIGTSFYIYLPEVVVEDENSLSNGDEIIDNFLPRGTETVLIVEDDESVCNLAQNILQMQGYTVLTAFNADEALRMANRYPDPIHLILTDVVMPGMNGRRLTESLQEDRPNVKVVYMSGYTDDVIVNHGVLEEGVTFLQKPFRPVTLTHTIRTALDAEV